MSRQPLEIERKFLVRGPLPDVAVSPGEELAQGYLAVENGIEVRLRSAGERRTLTVKSSGGLVRREIEVDLQPAQFDALWPATEGRRLEKRRHALPHEELVLEVDVYHGRLAGLVTVEVEFPDVAASSAFEPPEWFGAEVTEDPRYKNRSLALHGLPR